MTILACFTRAGSLYAQYTGGNSDGAGSGSATVQTLGIADSLYNGGVADGFTSWLSPANMIGIADSLYNGGTGDGFHSILSANNTISITDSLYNGGVGDGINSLLSSGNTIGITDSLYNGGARDGFGFILTLMQTIGITDSLYNGSIGKGDIVFYAPSVNLNTCGGDTIVWNGGVSNAWGLAANWDCGVVPGINSNVVIPTGRPRYPVVGSNREIRSLLLQPGSSVNVNSGFMLKLNGQ